MLPADFYPGKGLRAGRVIPKGYVVVTRRAVLGPRERRATRLTCPSGYRMRNLATSTLRLGFLVHAADRDYYLRRRSVRMTLETVQVSSDGPGATASAARGVRGTMAGLCRRRG